jgi:hypothetical protein
MQCVNGSNAEWAEPAQRSDGRRLPVYTLLTVSVKTRANFKPI